ncbi:MAG: 4Fe-4S binding protein [Anaerolineae bacterium]
MCDSHATKRLIVPPSWALDVLQSSGDVYLRDCPCRSREQNCPPETWRVCLLFGAAAEEDLAGATLVDRDQALGLVERSVAQGMIFNLFYREPDGAVTELCSCCTCCCSPLRRLKAEGTYERELRNGHLAITDPVRCTACGLCLDACAFGARSMQGATVVLDRRRCFGCGRCVSGCPVGAIRVVIGGRQPG